MSLKPLMTTTTSHQGVPKKRMRKRRITDAKRAKSEVVIYGLEETIYEDDNELYWLSEAKKFIKFTEELSPLLN